GTVGSLAYSPDSAMVVSALVENGAIRLWQTATWEVKQSFYSKPFEYEGRTCGSQIWTVAFSPDGKTVASGGDDQVVSLWDVKTGHLLRTCVGHDYSLFCVTFSPNGKLIASASSDQTVRIWDFKSCAELAMMVADPGDDGHGAYQVAF